MAENFFGLTDTGKVRSNNEDTFIAQTLNSKYILAAVIDGVGGYNGGEVAAAIAREQMISLLSANSNDVNAAMIQAFRSANNAIAAKKQEAKELDSMACVATLTMVDVANNRFQYAHVGDTRLYLLRDASLVKISKDHSFVGFLEDSGRLSEREAMDHPKRNEINKALGFTSQIDADESFIETGESPFLPGDMLLLCSDGLTDMVDKDGITQILIADTLLEEKATRLINAANKNGGHDNVTVVLVQNDKTPQHPVVAVPTVDLKKSPDQITHPKATPEPEPIVTRHDNKRDMPQKKSSNLYAVIITILCLVFIGAAVYCYTQWQKELNKQEVATQAEATPEKKPRNAQEIQLQNAINMLKGDTLVITDSSYKQPVIITDTLDITRPKLFIRVKGNLTLQADSSYTGPAFTLRKEVKSAGFINFKLQGFKTGISSYNIPLILRNVQFSDCLVSVQKLYALPAGKAVNENVGVTPLIADSLNKAPKPANGSR